ncbi:MAG: DUF2061 domain-containing protein [Thaumarchaeota archaeon]|nr:DUF2061 domain-containing protein [Nitrososphaerota archaeon]
MESHKRTIVKTAIYRGFTTVFLAVLTWLYTGSLQDATFVTIVFNVVATVFYYFHERAWLRIRWGIKDLTSAQNT